MAKVQKIVVWVLLALYMLALIWLIVFKANRDLLLYGGEPEYRQIAFSLYFNGAETLLNVAAFAPLGLFLALQADKRRFVLHGIVCLLVSFAFECVQYIRMLGTSDLTDLITNTLGGMLGILLYAALARVLGEKAKKILFWLAIPATLAFCVLALTF